MSLLTNFIICVSPESFHLDLFFLIGCIFFLLCMPVKFELDVRHCDLLGLDILYSCKPT